MKNRAWQPKSDPDKHTIRDQLFERGTKQWHPDKILFEDPWSVQMGQVDKSLKRQNKLALGSLSGLQSVENQF